MRIKDFDYSRSGYYYVTICTYEMECIFGEIEDDKMILNNAGEMVSMELNRLPKYSIGVLLDECIVMPNHVHAIIVIDRDNNGMCNCGRYDYNGPALRPVPTAIDNMGTGDGRNKTLSDIVHDFKSITTKKYSYGVKNNNWKPFSKHVWQRSFYDHVIRNEESLENIRKYIIDNPATWATDENNRKKQIVK